jgi:exosome complex component RRP41
MEKIVEQTFSSVVMLEYYIKSDINIEVSVMESDGSLICCIINAVCMALVHAGIMLNDLVVACSAGITANKLVCADLTQLEENHCYMPVAIKGRTKEIVHMQLDARLSLDRLKETMDASQAGCEQVLAYMDQHLRAYVLDSIERQ